VAEEPRDVERWFWELRFRCMFLEAHASDFESLVQRIMELRFPDEYIPVKAAGQDGDWKNDGLLTVQRRLLQVYAPEGFDKKKTLAKIAEDYAGAVDKWGDRFDTWTFVNNSVPGLPPYAVDKLLELSDSDDRINCEQWSYPKLRQLVFELDRNDLASLLGPPVSRIDILSVEVADVIPILRAIETTTPAGLDKVRPVPPDKLDENGLSEDAAALLLLGMRRADEVQRYFAGQTQRPNFRDDLGARFHEQYVILRDMGLDADGVLAAMVEWVAGPVLEPVQQAAALAVVAYFFEQCDIYERPSGMDHP
jgi:hypothetical protein